MSETPIDGCQVLLASSETWLEIVSDPRIDGLPVQGFGLSQWETQSHLALIGPFQLGFQLIHIISSFWMPLTVGCFCGELYRVHPEVLTCTTCQWSGITATASVSALYDCVAQAKAAQERGWSLPVVVCPSCQSDLPQRRPVWAEV